MSVFEAFRNRDGDLRVFLGSVLASLLLQVLRCFLGAWEGLSGIGFLLLLALGLGLGVSASASVVGGDGWVFMELLLMAPMPLYILGCFRDSEGALLSVGYDFLRQHLLFLLPGRLRIRVCIGEGARRSRHDGKYSRV